jgi:ABC-type multidrug transport system ATPase subunit
MKNIYGCISEMYIYGSYAIYRLHLPVCCQQTTLLNILSETVPKDSLRIYGQLDRLNGDSSSVSVFVQQEDLLFGQLTVKETLATAAALKTSDDHTACDSYSDNSDSNNSIGDKGDRATDGAVDKSILRLGLKKATNTRVGQSTLISTLA